jgi:hypothetical protein
LVSIRAEILLIHINLVCKIYLLSSQQPLFVEKIIMKEFNSVTSLKMQKLVAVVFIGALTIVFLNSFDMIKSKVRDIKRRADINLLVQSLDLYHDQFGRYPISYDDWRGWDLSMAQKASGTDFIKKLSDSGFLDRTIGDPVNDARYHYRYQKYPAGSYGCTSPFYILQVISFELPTDNNGFGRCPGFDWSELLPNGYTVQGFE